VGEAFRVVRGADDATLAPTFTAKRERLGLSQRQVADALGLDANDVADIESGRASFARDTDYTRAVCVLERAVGGSL